MTGLVDEVESLYQRVVMEPGSWVEEAFSDWVQDVGQDTPVSRDEARYVRQCVRIAQKLRTFWVGDARVGDESIGWLSRVDLAFGPKAWRPVLALSQIELAESGSYESFTRTADLFAVVNNAPFLGGVAYTEWIAESGGIDGLG